MKYEANTSNYLNIEYKNNYYSEDRYENLLFIIRHNIRCFS